MFGLLIYFIHYLNQFLMKKLYFLFMGVAFAALFMNNARGPVIAQQRGYTGAPGDATGTCANCHNSGSFGASAKIEVFDSLGTTAVRSYQLGRLYTIRMTISVTAGTPSGYGFQMIDIRRRDSSNVKGFLPKSAQAANIGIDTITASRRVYAEHNGVLTSNVINVKWRAPATDLGTIAFFGAGNAVNTGGSSAGDNGTASTSVQLPSPISLGTKDLESNFSVSVSPNPTPAVATLLLNSKVASDVKVQVLDLQGRNVWQQSWAIGVGENQKSVDLGRFPRGAYMIQVIDNQNVVSKRIVKM
jgi:Secretion system C-terminal sorting domain